VIDKQLKQKKKHTRKGGPDNRSKPVSPIKPEALIAQVWALIEPVCEYEGIELVHVEYQQESGGRILRLYIDRSSGVTLDDCVNVSRIAGDLLDMELDDFGSYGLEVSSPGENRPLSKESDFRKFKGKKAMVQTNQPLDGRKKFRGVLSGVSEGMVTLLADEKTVSIPFHKIRKAQLINIFGE